uniref:U-scoloptoxin(16)-Sm4a n=1 Tax=Scolopendra morsitans TaxID=943129 RepID=TXG4A_SCOMO|nr:RecName: Full=U-scoloptoxin(16)-Sm4a; Short=U-SLPTX(16)-Sm4a; Flags: Precursor [Scolopendra morsitans]
MWALTVFVTILAAAIPITGVTGVCEDMAGNGRAPGEVWTEDSCTLYECGEDDSGELNTLFVAGCPLSLEIPKGCHYEPRSGNFPYCCPLLVCPDYVDKKNVRRRI